MRCEANVRKRYPRPGVDNNISAVFVYVGFFFGPSKPKTFVGNCSFVFLNECGHLQVDLAIAGYPCKSVSSQNNFRRAFTDPSSSTGGGFCALMNYVSYSSPSIVICENVSGLAFQRKSFQECPISIQNSAMAKKGYRHWHTVVSSKDYGLCHSRSRCWAIYIKESESDLETQPASKWELFLFVTDFCFGNAFVLGQGQTFAPSWTVPLALSFQVPSRLLASLPVPAFALSGLLAARGKE